MIPFLRFPKIIRITNSKLEYSNQLIEWLGDMIIGFFKKEKTQVDNPAGRYLAHNFPSISLVDQQSQCA